MMVHTACQGCPMAIWAVCPWRSAHLQRSSLRHLKAVLSRLKGQRASCARSPEPAGHACVLCAWLRVSGTGGRAQMLLLVFVILGRHFGDGLRCHTEMWTVHA